MGKREKDNKKEKKDKKKKNKLGKIFGTIIAILIIALGVFLGYSIAKNGGGLQGLVATILGQDMEELQDLDTLNVLVLGVSEDIETELTDTIMVCSYNTKTQRASMLSVPRDTFIGKNKNKAKGSDKINSLYASKGAEGDIKAVSELTGMDLKYYVVVNNQVVVDLINTIGGVYFDVPIDMDYDDPTQDLHIHLKAGYQKIDGDHAEQLLRFRHNNDGTSYPMEYGDNDYGRMKTQRAFLIEVAKQALKIQNITKIRTIMTTIFQNVETNLTLEELFPYVPWAVSFDTANISSNQIAGESQKCNDLWFFVNDEDETEEVVEKMTSYLDGVVDSTEVTNTTNETDTNTNTTSSNTTNTTKTKK